MVKETFLEESVREFIRLVEAGNTLEAIERFYHAEIVQTENSGEPTLGKAKLRSIEECAQGLSKSIVIRVSAIAIDESTNQVSGEMQIDYLDGKMEKRTVKEFFVQNWKEEKIIRQEFCYQQL